MGFDAPPPSGHATPPAATAAFPAPREDAEASSALLDACAELRADLAVYEAVLALFEEKLAAEVPDDEAAAAAADVVRARRRCEDGASELVRCRPRTPLEARSKDATLARCFGKIELDELDRSVPFDAGASSPA